MCSIAMSIAGNEELSYCYGYLGLHTSTTQTSLSPLPQLVPTRDSIHKLQTKYIHVQAAS